MINAMFVAISDDGEEYTTYAPDIDQAIQRFRRHNIHGHCKECGTDNWIPIYKEDYTVPKTERIDIRISPELKAKLQQAADEENRTVSNYIINLIQKDLKERRII